MKTLSGKRRSNFVTGYLMSNRSRRLLDIVHADQKLYLVFEFLDVDLKRYMEMANQNRTPITLDIVKVSLSHHFPQVLERVPGCTPRDTVHLKMPTMSSSRD